ncbi:MAG: class I SAM-dependent rRNA methyltransferase [Firmicutes bacterium]|nr:class I SAM-dependent rRNA methyltransferase [Bacillota bacterium]
MYNHDMNMKGSNRVNMKNSQIILKPGREKNLLKKHPWVFSGGIQKVNGDPMPGDTVTAVSSKGEFTAYCAFSPQSQIRLRVWSWNEKDKINEGFFDEKIRTAIALRKNLGLFSDPTINNSCRVINSESDGLPGIIADLYNRHIVVQFLTTGAEKWKDVICRVLYKQLDPICFYERSDSDERLLEGLKKRNGLISGNGPSKTVEIVENGIKMLVDIKEGHKTGFYIDQRNNRRLIRDFAAGKDVLNCFSYTGGFSLNAAAGGAKHIVSADASKKVLETAAANVALNGFSPDKFTFVESDVFKLLRQYKEEERYFDLIVLDPPKFVSGTAKLETALRGYKDLNLQALRILKPGGVLFTFSCSGSVTDEMFQKATAWAALDAECSASVIGKMIQGPDHPVLLSFPESSYLKGLVLYKS